MLSIRLFPFTKIESMLESGLFSGSRSFLISNGYANSPNGIPLSDDKKSKHATSRSLWFGMVQNLYVHQQISQAGTGACL